MAKAKCKKYDLCGNEIGEIEIDYGDEQKINNQLIKSYIVAMRNNARQWSANSKGRGESHHSHQKPHRQKGTGKARQGFLGAPQYKGGGVVFGPKPKFDQHVRINRKERHTAIRSLIIERMKEGNLVLLDTNFDKYFPEPRTKSASQLFNSVGECAKRMICCGKFGESSELINFKLSLRNLPNVSFLLMKNINGYDILVNKKIFVLDSAVEELEGILRG